MFPLFQTSWFHFPLSFPSTGEDFTVEPLVITVPANQQRYAIQHFFTIKDDDIDEDEQSFAIVAEIGPDVPDAFRLQNGRQIVLGDGEPFKLESQTMIVSFKRSLRY